MAYYINLPENVYISETPPVGLADGSLWLKASEYNKAFRIKGPHLLQPSISAECFDSSVIESTNTINLFSFEYRPEFMVYNAATNSWESHLYVDEKLVKSCVDLLTYEIENGCCHITGYDWEKFNITDLVIPDYIEGFPVTKIEGYAFCGIEMLESLVLPDTLVDLGYGTFDSCYKLKSVTLGKGITSIPDWCFSNCGALTAITLPRNITSIGEYAFSYCTALTTLALPHSVTSIDEYAFYYCTALARFTVDPQNSFFATDYYGNLVSKDGTRLISPALVDGIFKIPKTFSNVDFSDLRWQVEGFFVEPGHDNFATDAHGVVFNRDMTELICAPTGLAGDYVVPDGITEIPDSAFSNCNIASITLPSSVTSLGYGAFRNCDYLESVTIIGYLSKMGEWCFEGCSKLVNFDCPGLANIAFEHEMFSNIFRDCSKLPRTNYDGGIYLGSTTNPYFCLGTSRIADSSAVTIHPDTVLIANGGQVIGDPNSELIIPKNVKYLCNCSMMDVKAKTVRILSKDIGINKYAFSYATSVTDIYCAFDQDSIWASSAPWGAANATIHWNCVSSAHTGGYGN